MSTDSTYQLRRKVAASVSNAEDADQLRIFLDDATGLLAAKDSSGVVTPIGADGAFIHNPVVTSAASPYAAVIRETVKVDPSGGPVQVDLPTAVGNAGRQIQVINVTTSTNPITSVPFGAQTVNGSPNYVMNTPRERVLLESDGSNWIAG